jgi:hypothetical protein
MIELAEDEQQTDEPGETSGEEGADPGAGSCRSVVVGGD